jgi:hypothetical protein
MMGFTIYYRSTRPVTQTEAEAIQQTAHSACARGTWLGCEPVWFFGRFDGGYLLGGSKPNFTPDPDDAAAAARSGLPNGTTMDMLAVLCQLSRDHGIDWELSHDNDPLPIGLIRNGACDDRARAEIKAYADYSDSLGGWETEDPE